MHTILRRKLRHHKIARAVFRLFLVGVFLLVFFLVWPIFFLWLNRFLEYAPGQIINPWRFSFDLALALFFFLIFWSSSTLGSGLKWLLLLLGAFDAEYILNFVVYLIVRPGLLGLGDWIATPLYSVGLFLCVFSWARNWGDKRVVRVVVGVSIFSIAVTWALYISYYGTVVGTGRALVTGLVGPYVALIGITLRARGDWPTREQKQVWFVSKEMNTEDWTRPDEEIIEADIDSYNKTNREAVIHICRFDTGGKCEDRVLRVSDSLGSLVWNEIEEFDGKDAHLSIGNGQINALSFYGIPKKGDQRILEATAKLCSQLDLSDVRTTWLFWKRLKVPVEIWPHYQGPPYWLRLDERPYDKLDSSEWEPLIMSSLVLHKMNRRRKIVNLLQGVLISSATFLLWFPWLGLIIHEDFPGAVPRTIMFVAGLVCLAGLTGAMKTMRRARLRADELSGKKFGETKFIGIFEKLERLSPTQRGLSSGVLHLFESEPSVEERIRHMLRNMR